MQVGAFQQPLYISWSQYQPIRRGLAANGSLHCAESTRKDFAFTAKSVLRTIVCARQQSLCASPASLTIVCEAPSCVIMSVVDLFYTMHNAASAVMHYLLLGMAVEGDTEFSILKK